MPGHPIRPSLGRRFNFLVDRARYPVLSKAGGERTDCRLVLIRLMSIAEKHAA
jgi:hypothetical protein